MALPSPDFPDGVSLSYVVLAKDKLLSPKVQRTYAGTLRAASIIELEAGHEAPLTHVAEVAEVLLSDVKERQEEPVIEEAPVEQEVPTVEEEAEIEAGDE